MPAETTEGGTLILVVKHATEPVKVEVYEAWAGLKVSHWLETLGYDNAWTRGAVHTPAQIMAAFDSVAVAEDWIAGRRRELLELAARGRGIPEAVKNRPPTIAVAGGETKRHAINEPSLSTPGIDNIIVGRRDVPVIVDNDSHQVTLPPPSPGSLAQRQPTGAIDELAQRRALKHKRGRSH